MKIQLTTPEQRRLATMVRDKNLDRETRQRALADLMHLTTDPTAPVPAVLPPVPETPLPVVNDGWIWLATYRLESAAIDGNQARVAELVAEFQAKGLEIPAHRGYIPPIKDVPPRPEREPLPYPNFDQRGPALYTYRVRPKGPQVVNWDEGWDDWN